MGEFSRDQFEKIIAAILGAGAAAGQEGGCNGARAVVYYKQALKKIHEEGLEANT